MQMVALGPWSQGRSGLKSGVLIGTYLPAGEGGPQEGFCWACLHN